MSEPRPLPIHRGRSGESAPQDVPLVSVVMTVFNGGPFLAEAVESILGQAFGDFEFVIIDDGSTDGSAQVLDSYARADSRIRLSHQPNRGRVYSLNHACALARGKYIALMDADDVSYPERLMWQVDLMERHPELGVVGGQVEYIDAQGSVFERPSSPLDHSAMRADLFRLSCPLINSSAVMRKSVFLSTGDYRGPFVPAEDYDLWLRFALASQLANLDRIVLKYRHHSGQLSHQKLQQQVFGTLAARELALSEGRKSIDLLRGAKTIGPSELASLGVSVEVQQRYLAARYCDWICRLDRQGEISAALNLATEMLDSSNWQHAERRAMADVWLTTASLYWRQGMPFHSLMAFARAVATRPVMVGRPVKRLLRRLGIEFRRQPDPIEWQQGA